MKTELVIKTSLDEFASSGLFGYSDDSGNWIFVKHSDDKAISEASKHFGISEKFIGAIAESMEFAFDDLIERISEDLIDIWKGLDKDSKES